MKRRLLIIIVIIFAFNLVTPTQQQKSNNSDIQIQKAWARPAAKYANSAFYFVLENNSSRTDTLLGAETKISEEAEIHESYKKDNDRMGMRPAGKIAIKPKSKFEFKPGGFHVMLLGVEKDLHIGDKIEVVLRLKYAGKIKAQAEVRDMPMTKEMKQ
ncbi:MAG: copper chaperone PCu(A)C [Melioribacter sp.]|nr:copper chaperone PCu(A)C [Melioribacter sp.]